MQPDRDPHFLCQRTFPYVGKTGRLIPTWGGAETRAPIVNALQKGMQTKGRNPGILVNSTFFLSHPPRDFPTGWDEYMQNLFPAHSQWLCVDGMMPFTFPVTLYLPKG
jgi:hypothetical protein